MQSRRAFCRCALRISAGAGFAACNSNWAQPVSALSIRPGKGAPVTVPANFTGLGYEMSSVAATGLLRPSNARYLNLVRALGHEGVLRVGGIVANYTSYNPSGTSKADRLNTIITRQDIAGFAEFLRHVGWKAIWSVNFAQGTIDAAIEEARAVHQVLGPRLLAIELGNEVEAYGASQPFRTAPYTYEQFRREFDQWREAILKAVPGLPFAAPDTAANVDWVEKMALDAKGAAQLLTTHYYRNGQQHGDVEQLLTPDPRLDNIAARLRIASQKSGLPWRMCEMNSFSGGGRPGVSDTIVGALWTLDVMLRLALSGCAGVNIETGVNQLGFVSSYSPILDDGNGNNSAGAPYYGMLAFATAFAGCHQMFPLETELNDESISCYALGSGGRQRKVVIVNRSRATDVRVSIEKLSLKNAKVLRLEAPSPESTTGVTFGGAAVDESGRWQPAGSERVHGNSVDVPRLSAAVLRADS